MPEAKASRIDDIVDASLRDAAIMDRDGYPYIIHPLMDGIPRVEPALLEAWTRWAEAQTDILDGATVLLAPEAMALPLATALSLRIGVPYLCVRKRKYGLANETMAYCETGYGESCLYVNGLRPDDRIVVIDDVLSTGGTMTALLSTLQGLDATVGGALVFVEKGGHLADVAAKTGVPVRALRSLVVETPP